MNAVDILRSVENFFNRNHNFFCLWGGLFAMIFFGLYVPFNIYSRTMEMYEAQIRTNQVLTSQLDHMSRRVEFLNLSYDQQRKVRTEVECLAKNIYFEAGSESRAGKIAVAEVTMNRVKSREFPRTVCGVVYQRTRNTCQFSWVCQGKNTIRPSSVWNESYKIAENILISKKSYGIIGSAKYFHATYVNPAWATEKRVVNQIGNHIFYH